MDYELYGTLRTMLVGYGPHMLLHGTLSHNKNKEAKQGDGRAL